MAPSVLLAQARKYRNPNIYISSNENQKTATPSTNIHSPISVLGYSVKILIRQRVRSVAQVKHQHRLARLQFRERNIDSFLESGQQRWLRPTRQISYWTRECTNRRRMAGSSSHGTFVAPSTRIPSWLFPTPCIWTRNSVLMRRVESLSPSVRLEQSESISSIKMMAGFFSRAISNKFLTSLFAHRCSSVRGRTAAKKTIPPTHFSLSPCHLDTRLDDDTAKNVESASVATALARYDLPVPGGYTTNGLDQDSGTICDEERGERTP
jgi:hypothetical protein